MKFLPNFKTAVLLRTYFVTLPHIAQFDNISFQWYLMSYCPAGVFRTQHVNIFSFDSAISPIRYEWRIFISPLEHVILSSKQSVLNNSPSIT